MIMNITSFLSNIDKNSQFLLILIGIISFLLILVFIINYFNSRKARRIIKKQKLQKKKLIEEIENESKNIVNENIKAASIPVKEEVKVVEEVEVLDDNIEMLEIEEVKEEVQNPTINLNEYEKEEENSAVISYGELCKKFNVEKKVYAGPAQEVLNKVTDIIENKPEHKFKPTTYVSPIFGREEEKDQTFLQNLKEFRNGLE